ncbi:hypothetical protein NPIL_176111 [Nephila pilipes]|uniref:Uncharacterized protein n=1 Tax=Nephila pilipes TaxID=299642 RepID=A0A8X6N4H8_NEPPI|nr:hypothetical protein NPIL_176111 [Nephila pilipes]
MLDAADAQFEYKTRIFFIVGRNYGSSTGIRSRKQRCIWKCTTGYLGRSFRWMTSPVPKFQNAGVVRNIFERGRSTLKLRNESLYQQSSPIESRR